MSFRVFHCKSFNGLFWLALYLLTGVLFSLDKSMALTQEEMNTISAYEKVAPSVVNISTTACDQEVFFCPIPQSNSGSGIVFDEDGTIVTNYHVIATAENIQVVLSDGRRLKADIVGKAPSYDLAVIRVEVGDRRLQPITLADSDYLEVGTKVLAIGNPFGLGQTLTTGTVSMKNRDIKSGNMVFQNLIQTDAPINPGNSGGALVTSKGELIGINTVIFSPTGSNIGIGFAIPVNSIKKVMPGMTRTWEKSIGWILAILLVFWLIRRVYRTGRG